MKLRLVFSFCFITAAFSAEAQKKVVLTDVKGSWVISSDITLTQAREKAIQQAKLEALRLADVPEQISESNILYKSDKKRDFQEIFKSIVTTSVSGEISAYQVTQEEKRIDTHGELAYNVTINCTVLIQDTKEDPSFNMEVTGIREMYQSPDQLLFSIKPFKSGFLTIFYLGDTMADQIYPNGIERQEKLEGGRTYHFPRSKALEYEVSTKGSLEVNYLVLLYTKHEIPFTKTQTIDNILQFLASIDRTEKCLKNYVITIKK